MDYLVNGRHTLLRAGEGIVVNARRMHYGFSAQRRECDFVCLLLHPDLLGGSHIREKFVRPLTDDRAFDFCRLAKEPWHAEILACIRAVYDCAASPTAELKTSEYFLRIWSCMYLHLKGAETARDPDLVPLRGMLDCIHRRFDDALTLAEIARGRRMQEQVHRSVPQIRAQDAVFLSHRVPPGKERGTAARNGALRHRDRAGNGVFEREPLL